jgi:ubiquinone/menaquinone biosynthesis C-methylase UbiE
MTWEEIIYDIRKRPEFDQLVKDAYLGADLIENVSRFASGEEFTETLKLITSYGINPPANVLDIGAGNGIATVAFAQKGFFVHALEPDPSNTIGAGAIRELVSSLKLTNLIVSEKTAEQLDTHENNFDLVYVRQAVHHANDLSKFVTNAVASLKPGGVYLALRDHVIFDQKDKEWFLQSHPLHKYYGGENAFTLKEYLNAMEEAGLINIRYWKYYESAINYLPISTATLNEKAKNREDLISNSLTSKFGKTIGNWSFIRKWYEKRVERKLGPALDERLVPGRPYSFIGIKPLK